MRAFLVVLVATSACGFSVSSGDDTGDDDDDAPAVPACRTDVAGALAGMRVPGVSAAVVAGGELACVAVAGDADIAAGRAVAPDTVFAWASVSKTVTATAAMILYDEGRFALDDDVADYLPFPVENPNCPGR